MTQLELFLVDIWPYTTRGMLSGSDKKFKTVMLKLLDDGRFGDWMDLDFLLTLCYVREYNLTGNKPIVK